MRLRSGLMYTLSELSNNGHVYAKKQQLANKASELPEAFLEKKYFVKGEAGRCIIINGMKSAIFPASRKNP